MILIDIRYVKRFGGIDEAPILFVRDSSFLWPQSYRSALLSQLHWTTEFLFSSRDVLFKILQFAL